MKHTTKHIAVIDLETDPFEYGKMIYPFVAGFYDGTTYKPFWSEKCIDELFTFLRSYPEPLLCYAHNGGRFDFFYCLSYLSAADMRIINNRIVVAKFEQHELRDSYAIMPFPLSTYKKTPIDYGLFTRQHRNQNRDAIISYLRDDCIDLHTLCVAFHEEFGDKVTIGSASMGEFKKFHTFANGNKEFDEKFRKTHYFGGRNQCFRTGILTGNFRVYDVNSMYPEAMRSYLHPVSTGIYKSKEIDEQTAFITVRGRNHGAFPIRQKDNSLDFTTEYGTYSVSIHEYQAAIDTGSFEPDRILETRGFSIRTTFADFIDHFYNARLAAGKNGDEIRKIFYKYVMNSCYGKFAQNPENYFDFYLTHHEDLPPDWHVCKATCPEPCRELWTPSYMCEDYIIWKRPLQRLSYFNIATGASITGAARAMLLRGLAASTNPCYCDTDSIICDTLNPSVGIHDTRLGAWKLEATGTTLAIGGKKLYALFGPDGTCIKKAHKGAKLSGADVLAIAAGNTIEYPNPVPTFKFDGSHIFTKRKIKATHGKTILR